MRSKPSEKHLSLAILIAVTAVQAVALLPELSPTVVRQSDATSHFTLIEGMADAVSQGENPLDFWSPETGFGYPIVRTYQILAHGTVTLAYFPTGVRSSKEVSRPSADQERLARRRLRFPSPQ